MIETISHHGSDDISGWSNSSNNIGFAHALLAIIDITSPGIQPMKGQANQTIVYNGEIYNYREIRDTESERGRKFNLKSYTECVLAA